LSWSKNRNRDKYFKRDGALEALGDTHLAFSPSLIAAQQLTYTLRLDLPDNFIGVVAMLSELKKTEFP
jgi:iron complex outermembrane receptor protein